MNVMLFSLVIYASYFEKHRRRRAPRSAVHPDGARDSRRLLLGLADPAPGHASACARESSRMEALHRHRNAGCLWLQRHPGVPRRPALLLRYGLCHRDPGARRQGPGARRQGKDGALHLPALPPHAQEGAAAAGRARALRRRRGRPARHDVAGQARRAHPRRWHRRRRQSPRGRIGDDRRIRAPCQAARRRRDRRQLNGAGVLQIRATRVGEAGTLAQIIRSVESAVASRTPLERAVDRAARALRSRRYCSRRRDLGRLPLDRTFRSPTP